MSNRKKIIAVFIIILFVFAAAVFAAVYFREKPEIKGDDSMTVGKSVSFNDITEFYYTYDSSANPPEFLRYRFYVNNGSYLFYREKREGNHWPLTTDDITSSETKWLSDSEWSEFMSIIEGGKVSKRSENTESGDSGPWLYIYWKGDKSKYQEFAFESYDKRLEFERFCESLSK